MGYTALLKFMLAKLKVYRAHMVPVRFN